MNRNGVILLTTFIAFVVSGRPASWEEELAAARNATQGSLIAAIARVPGRCPHVHVDEDQGRLRRFLYR